MNPETQVPPPAAEPTEAPHPCTSLPQPPFTRRGNGRIARLPKSVRDQVNNWLLDGVAYTDIIQRLGDQGKDLTPAHLSEYKKRGYLEWLRQREWFEHVTSKSEFCKDILAVPDTTALHEAGLRMAIAQMIDQLMRFNANEESDGAHSDPEHFVHLVKALARLTAEALALQKYKDAFTQAHPALQKAMDPDRDLEEKETRAIVRKVDRIFGLVSHGPAISPVPGPANPDQPPPATSL